MSHLVSYLKNISLFPDISDRELDRTIAASDGNRTAVFKLTEIRKVRSDLRLKTWAIIGFAISSGVLFCVAAWMHYTIRTTFGG